MDFRVLARCSVYNVILDVLAVLMQGREEGRRRMQNDVFF